ncbi:MAG: hypothetical protein IPJ61_13040 [Tessaracoccus sp.]|uniref:hypothetical protein n=1 Tax=Tessaracoccus sp. TaxID=1971211 RepID=UPI001EB3F0C5|nr:hypothetical protein [Tessaracoccus sp.]MBK7821963.1 hypothetical protein [Tessaracoccus sp.]
MIPAIAAVAGLALGASIAGGIAESTISKWSAKVHTLTAERDHFKTSFATATEQRDAALGAMDEAKDAVARREAAADTWEAQLDERADGLDDREAELDERADELDDQESSLTAREKAVGIAEKKAEAKSIYEGVWMVGEDIKPGEYRLREAFTGDICYWEISKDGRIVDNDLVTGGRPTVTLRKGQEFKNQGCGVWGKL